MEKSDGPILAVEGNAAYLQDWSERARAFGIERVEAISAMPMDARHHSKIDRVKLADLLKG